MGFVYKDILVDTQIPRFHHEPEFTIYMCGYPDC